MMRFLKTFAKSNSGAVAIDWLLLTATAVGLAIGAQSMMQADTRTASRDTAETVLETSPNQD